MIVQAVDTAAANIVVGIIVLAGFGALLCGVLFFCLAVRGIFRWLVGHTWGDVVASAGRKALR